ncbi:MAG: penicillin-binding protein [Bacilli bacterium]|nr:penicillin-binding protein [Bacilli bacterium]
MKIFRKILKFFLICFILLFIVLISIYGYSKFSPKLEIEKANNIIFYDNMEKIFFQGTSDNEWISLDNISNNVINATISAEDKNFYKHYGFDIFRIAKALYINVKAGKTIQGASTITQQYVKNLFLEFDKTWERKWNEMWLTLNMETHYSKDEILEGYLNTIYYGHGMYGVESASKYYFGKSSSDLSISEAAMLVAIPKSPSNYSPVTNYSNAKKRQEMILRGMYDNGYINEKELDKYLKEELTIIGKKEEKELSSVMYYKDAVIEELKTIKNIPTSFLDTGGLKIYTTLDVNAQEALESSLENEVNNNNLQAAGIMMNPNDGSIIALIGGINYDKSQFNRATNSKRQVGSTMKPFLYYSALENGFTSSTSFTSEETTFVFSNGETYSPRNAGEIYGNEAISLAAAIAYSDNIYAVKTHMFLGEENLVNMANRLGITTKLDAVPSLPLGTYEINIIEMTSAYASFANLGYKVNPHLITKVEDINGNVLYEYNEEPELILNQSLVYILNDLLTTTYDASFIDYSQPTLLSVASKLSKKYAVKSGTTATDCWTIGYNPDVVTSIWIGYDDATNLESGTSIKSKNTWAYTMENYLKDKEEVWYKKPSNVIGVLVDPINGSPVVNNDSKKRILYYLKGTEPTGEEMVFDELYEE